MKISVDKILLNPKQPRKHFDQGDMNAHFVKGKGFAGWQPSERAIQWVEKARAMGWGWTAIKRSMKSPFTPTALKNNFSKRLGKGV